MATTGSGSPYVVGTDNITTYPTTSLALANRVDAVESGAAAALTSGLAAKTDTAMTQNAQTGTSYSYALADASKLLSMSNAASNTVLVTKQATVTWVTGTQLRVVNLGAGVTTLVADTGVTINNNKALNQYQGGTLIRTASDVWTFQPNGGSGKILQVVQGTTTTSTTSTSATYADTTLTVSITPTLATSKVLILVAQNLAYDGVGDTVIDLRIVRDATAVSTLARYIQSNGSQSSQGSFAASYLDSPNTTAATTYKTQFRRASGSNTIYAQNLSAPSTIIVMEVAA